MKSRIVLFITGLILWILFTLPFNFKHLIVGIIVVTFTVILVGDMFVKRPHQLKEPKRYLWLLYYIPVFVWECLKANLDVAYRVAHPDLPIKPGIVKVKTKLKSDTGLTFLANSITLTPGTMSVDIDREKGYIYVHWINVTDTDIESATKKVVTRFENILEKIFE